jgi:hypothetical protein
VLGKPRNAILPKIGHEPNISWTAINARCGAAFDRAEIWSFTGAILKVSNNIADVDQAR